MRAMTQRGEDICTAMLKVASPRVHTKPATRCASRLSGAQGANAMPAIARPATTHRPRSSASLVKRARSAALDNAPIIAPKPKPPSSRP